MSDPAFKPLDVPAFLAFAQRQERGRFELWGGEIVAMAPERVGHVRAKALIWRAFASAVEAGRLPCEAFVDGLAVVVDANTAYEPDVLVNCGSAIRDEDALVATAPVIVVEVLSPGSANRDKTLKVEGYFRVATIAHYLVVDLSKRLVLHYRRDDGARLSLSIVREGALALDPPGLSLPLSEIFR